MPPEVINKAHSLERTAQSIVTALDRDGVEQALNAREAYKKVSDTLLEARNITDEAIQAVQASGGEGVSAAFIEATLANITKRHSQATVRVISVNNYLPSIIHYSYLKF